MLQAQQLLLTADGPLFSMIFVSTGHFRNKTPQESTEIFLKNNIKNIEFSGGKYQKLIYQYLGSIKNDFNVQIHNYFPVPKKPIVINLASQNTTVINDSLKLIKKSIDLTQKLRGRFFSFHAGYLIDMTVKDFGKTKNFFKRTSWSDGMEIFLKNVFLVSKYARKKNIEILIENNVLGKANFKFFKNNPFLMADYQDTKHIMTNTPDNVNLLCDLGHLKVSSNSLKFDAKEAHIKSKKWIKAYHVSDNSGAEDTNSETSEVYTENFTIIRNQIKTLKNIINASK
jgi:sugar phosphate isomerase/epimerase